MTRMSGPRVGGAIYAETDVTYRGVSPTSYVYDPPLRSVVVTLGPVQPFPLPRTSGSKPDVTTVYDVYDRTEACYENVMDWLEEAKTLGVSHRLPDSFPFGVLTSDSRLILEHPRAWITHPGNYYRRWTSESDGAPRCPFGVRDHLHVPFNTAERGAPMCVSLWEQDVRGGEIVRGTRLVRRKVTDDVSYFGFAPPNEERERDAERAYFVGVPIQRLAVVRDRDGRAHEMAERLAIAAQLPVRLADE